MTKVCFLKILTEKSKVELVAPPTFEEVELVKSAFKEELTMKQTFLFEKQTLILSY